jgi:uncharacterized membrane protein YdjX (TVP38/TMEM64 family)
MVEFLRRLGRFLSAMDAKAMTSVAISLILLVFVILMFLYGQQWLRLNDDTALLSALARAAQSPWAILGVVSVFSLLALTGFPQILLFAATVIVFGPRTGALYCWIATMASATLTFGIGHFLGGRWVKRIGGERMQRTVNFLSHRGILACAMIRVIPSAPFIVVNATAGAAHIPLWKFWTGTGIGIVPKILLVAVLGALAPSEAVFQEGIAGIVDFFTSREPRDLALLALIIAAWLGFLLFVRWLYQRLRSREGAF